MLAVAVEEELRRGEAVGQGMRSSLVVELSDQGAAQSRDCRVGH